MIASWQENSDKPRQCVEKLCFFRDTSLLANVYVVKATVFIVVMTVVRAGP